MTYTVGDNEELREEDARALLVDVAADSHVDKTANKGAQGVAAEEAPQGQFDPHSSADGAAAPAPVRARLRLSRAHPGVRDLVARAKQTVTYSSFLRSRFNQFTARAPRQGPVPLANSDPIESCTQAPPANTTLGLDQIVGMTQAPPAVAPIGLDPILSSTQQGPVPNTSEGGMEGYEGAVQCDDMTTEWGVQMQVTPCSATLPCHHALPPCYHRAKPP